ncbi:hypothetical protein BDK51DRAFT_39410 [Blyttiomyces helicus]|uniref:F-box domain-containing protein n=1 Tax=Blyttiomyces helicus TaxID=388810 RepID=A0A4P9W7J2_9FUNG|nr:hypothetical protein BDK51DRAFT_39410 [Blyttiomyces helicus]|eukprot:RKO88334.1 hypothetical protein BDK51DRAFT_39410 [Blyttiomyces helicus]
MTKYVPLALPKSRTLTRKRHHLPNEILVPILHNLWSEQDSLRLRTLASAVLVCRSWAPAASELLWMDPGPQSIRRLERFAITNEFSKARFFAPRQLGQAMRCLELLDAFGRRWVHSRMMAALAETTSLFSRLLSVQTTGAAASLLWVYALFRAALCMVAVKRIGSEAPT